MERLAAKPTVGVPQACRGWGETIAAYRFFDNESALHKVSEACAAGRWWEVAI